MTEQTKTLKDSMELLKKAFPNFELTSERVAFMKTVFGTVDNTVMWEACIMYVQAEEWFPMPPAKLWAYITKAKNEQDGRFYEEKQKSEKAELNVLKTLRERHLQLKKKFYSSGEFNRSEWIELQNQYPTWAIANRSRIQTILNRNRPKITNNKANQTHYHAATTNTQEVKKTIQY